MTLRLANDVIGCYRKTLLGCYQKSLVKIVIFIVIVLRGGVVV